MSSFDQPSTLSILLLLLLLTLPITQSTTFPIKMSPFNQPSTLSILLILTLPITQSTTFTLINKCTYTIWPGFLSNADTPQLSTTGFSLPSTTTTTLSITQSWSGRLWARTLCSINSTTDQFSCITGDCSTGTIQCSGNGATPPATLAEFTLNGADGLDFYDVSLVDGYNVPMAVVPQGGNNCSATGCVVDLNGSCPLKLRVLSLYGGGGGDRSVACRSACEAFGSPEYCCSGTYATPESCKPSLYSEFFKKACPTAYSYAYDDGTSTFTCKTGVDYVITFCPTTAALEKTTGKPYQMSPEVSPVPSVMMASAGGSLLRSPSVLMFIIPSIATFFFTLWSTSALLLL